MLTSALTHLRATLYRAITSPVGDAIAAVRVPKDLARRLNVALGRPLGAREELLRRDRARARMAELRGAAAISGPGGAKGGRSAGEPQPPVVVYCEKDRNARELQRIEELLRARGIAWTRLDVSGDEATMDFVLRRASCARDELPVVFVADRAIGGHAALVRAEAAGELPAGRPA